MKRFIALFLVMLISLPVFASGEDFSLRNGITFGDSMDTVLEKEKDNGLSFELTEEKNLIFPGVPRLKSESTTVAGQADSNILYYFDDDGLTAVLYYYNSFMSFFTGNKNIGKEPILSTLIEKYGMPFSENEFVDIGQAFDAMDVYERMTTSGYFDGSRYSSSLEQFFVPINGGFVEIMLLTVVSGSSEHRVISYSYRTDAEVNAVLDSVKNTEKSLADDL